MRQIILFDKNFDHYKKLSDFIGNAVAFEYIEILSFEQLLSILSILPEIDLLILNMNEFKNLNYETVISKIQNINKEVPVFTIGNYKEYKAHDRIFLTLGNFSEIGKEVMSLLGNTGTQKIASELPNYISVRFEFFKQYSKNTFPVAFYLRINQGGGNFQFIKRLNKDEQFSEEEILKIEKFNIEYIYVGRDEYQTFLQFSTKLILSQSKLSSSSKNSLSDVDYNLTRDVVNLLGVSEESVALVKENISKMESMISESQALASYLNKLKSNKLSYAYSHAYLISIILTKVVSGFDWDSKSINERICYIAFFHDISLNEDRFTRVQSEAELNQEVDGDFEFGSTTSIKKKVFKDFEIESINNHALNSAAFLDKIPNVPMGTSQVIREHHGSKNGIGFNDTQSPSLQPLSMIFIVVEEFVTGFLKFENPSNENIKLVIKELNLKYTKSNYKKAVEMLNNFVKK